VGLICITNRSIEVTRQSIIKMWLLVDRLEQQSANKAFQRTV